MFRVFAAMDQRMPLAEVADHARRAEALGYDGLNVPEAVHDGLLASGAALAATRRLTVATSVLVAFPRSPMAVAHAAWDLQASSQGRFELGLGPQVRGNIVGRYSTAWHPPVARMREYVGALRAIFARWQTGAPLAFEGEYYQFTRMQPFFDPGPLEAGPPPIHLGAIGPGMLALAGEIADGLMTHPTNTVPQYLREAILPRVAVGADRAERAHDAISIMIGGLVATGRDETASAEALERARQLLGFLYSTPAYWRTLELLGFEGLGPLLRERVAEGQWGDLAREIPEALLRAAVPCAPYAQIADVLTECYGGISRWITFPLPDDPTDEPLARRTLEQLRAG